MTQRALSGASVIPIADNVCEQRLAKTLTQLEIADLQIKSRDEQIKNAGETIALQEARFREILAILKEYATLDAKEKKSWWKKAGKKLIDILDMLTDPATIRSVAEIIILSKIAAK